METVVLKMLFIVSVSGQFGKHVYVQHMYTWPKAQEHCRHRYTDLSPITTRQDEEKLRNATIGTADGFIWIGLYRHENKWRWSGGGEATNIPWSPNQPDDTEDQKFACVCWRRCTWNGLHDIRSSHQLPFLCFNLITVEIKKTWEQAMWYCRNNHTALTSLTSEPEHLLALREIKHARITERVWIGLRYLGDRWLWVDHNPLVYQAWSQGGGQDYECPIHKRCGALTKEGVWENWDCQDKLHFICY